MTISELIERLQNAELDLSATEIAEVLWLWVKTVPSQVSEIPLPQQETAASSSTLDSSLISFDENRKSSSSSNSETPESIIADIIPKTFVKHLEDTSIKEKIYPIKVPDAPAIPNIRQIERALKPLRRNFSSSREWELNEAATVNRIVEQKLWIPVLKPVLTRRWLDLVLVIESNNSLVIWQQTIIELRSLLKRLGVFRQFDTWGLQANTPRVVLEWLLLKIARSATPQLWLLAILSHQNEGVQIFRYDDAEMRPYPPEAIRSGGGQTVILLVSDTISQGWYRPPIYTLLKRWSRQSMVNLLQLLPERLWSRTALGQQRQVKLSSPSRVVANHGLVPLSNSFWENIVLKESSTQESSTKESSKFNLPVTSLEPYILNDWSSMLMGVGGNQSLGYRVSPPQDARKFINSNKSITAKERVQRFQTIASPTALKLAELLAGVLVTLPVIRVIKYTMLPQANQSHVAEVLMGGLFKPIEGSVTPQKRPR